MAFEVANACPELWTLDRVVTSSSIGLVTNNRMLDPREMNTNLMCSAGFELNVEQGEAIKGATHVIERQRIATAAHDRHACPVRSIARQRLIDLPRACSHTPMDQRHIRLENRSIAKLIGKIFE